MDKDIKIRNKYIYLKPLDIIIVFFSHWNILKHITGVSTFLSTDHQIMKLQNGYSFLPGKRCCKTAQQDCFARINLKIALSSSNLPLSCVHIELQDLLSSVSIETTVQRWKENNKCWELLLMLRQNRLICKITLAKLTQAKQQLVLFGWELMIRPTDGVSVGWRTFITITHTHISGQ